MFKNTEKTSSVGDRQVKDKRLYATERGKIQGLKRKHAYEMQQMKK